MVQSIQAFVSIFRALLFFKGEDLPDGRRETVTKACGAFDLDASVFERVLDMKEGRTKTPNAEMNPLFKDYLRQVRKLAKLVDALGE